jgi:polygalacturonase
VSRTGRIKFGTESNGGFKNIAISNCVFDGCSGLAIETVDGAVIEDVSVTNLTMRDVQERRFSCGWERGCEVRQARRWVCCGA